MEDHLLKEPVGVLEDTVLHYRAVLEKEEEMVFALLVIMRRNDVNMFNIHKSLSLSLSHVNLERKEEGAASTILAPFRREVLEYNE